MEIMKTDAQTAINMIAGHLLDPCWDMKYNNINSEERNTLIVNAIYVKYPRIYNWPSIIKTAIKGRIKRW